MNHTNSETETDQSPNIISSRSSPQNIRTISNNTSNRCSPLLPSSTREAFNISPNRASHQMADRPYSLGNSQPFINFRVTHHLMNNDVVRPICYFAISVIVRRMTYDEERQLPEDISDILPVIPYHQNVIPNYDNLRRRYIWEQGENRIERRYSEMVELREYLVLMYPSVLIPPLVPKSRMQHIKSYMSPESHINHMKRRIKCFLDALCNMSEIMLYNPHLPLFFQQGEREYFEEWLEHSFRPFVQTLKSSSGHIEEHRSLYCRPAVTNLDTAMSIVNGTSKAIWGAVSFVMSMASDIARDQGGKSSYTEKAKRELENDPSFSKWWPVLQNIRERQIATAKAAEDYLKFLSLADMECSVMGEAADALGGYGTTLSHCHLFSSLEEGVRSSQQYAGPILSQTHSDEGRQCHSDIYELMTAERDWLSAIEDLIEFVMCLHTTVRELELDPEHMWKNRSLSMRKCLTIIDGRVMEEVNRQLGEGQWKRYEILIKNMIKTPLKFLNKELDLVSSHSKPYDREEEWKAQDALYPESWKRDR
eukprot:Tbor_TRINITY_DN6001_c3_g1::TRINITY_DN6001_c3_g1_i1::g.11294::m.11294